MVKSIKSRDLSENELATFKVLAEIAQDVYDPAQQKTGRWQKLNAHEVKAIVVRPEDLRDASTSLFDGKSDFKANIYKTDQDQIVVAFAGSQTKSDWYANLV